ncbi:unnamed protein product [Urochloa decumbens]|uniref:F-box domain-containing protein n=1 Tax=Urochloa decumbens TaxID=240449 RepID=A0ABC9G8K4_9POAL
MGARISRHFLLLLSQIRHLLPPLPMAPPSPRSGASVRPLPLDALYEVLLRVSARDLCRLRAVCRPWRALLSDPHFIAAHAACHPEPLIVATHHTDGLAAGHILDIMDLSGRVIKRVVKPESLWAGRKGWAITAHVNVVCVLMTNDMSYLLLNPATGAVSALPQGLAEEHSRREQDISDCRHLVAVGKVASTGEYKVLRVLDVYPESEWEQLCEVFTLDGSSHARWRGKKASPDSVDPFPSHRVTINGIVYFVLREIVMDQGVVPLRIASFDLETEEWRAILRAPLDLLSILHFSLASLNGCLVVIHYIQQSSSMDLWFLMDFDKGLWAKKHSIPLKSGFFYDDFPVRTLLVLNGGRILYYDEMKLLRIYDPKTCTSANVAEIGPYCEIGVYTGNLLSLPDGAGAQLMR